MKFAVRVVTVVTGLAWSMIALAAEPSEERPAALAAGRVVLVPINLAVRAVAEVEPGLEPVWRELLQYFASVENPVVALEREGAGALWNEVMAEVKEEADRGNLYAAYGGFARRLAEQTEFDSIVFPTLVTRAARVQGHTAHWDGVRRPVEVPGLPNDSIDTLPRGRIWIDRYGAQGELAAASLHVAVLSAEGELRFQGMGGLVLLQELAPPRKSDSPELSTVLRKEAFADPAQLRGGIAAAFR